MIEREREREREREKSSKSKEQKINKTRKGEREYSKASRSLRKTFSLNNSSRLILFGCIMLMTMKTKKNIWILF